MKRIIYAVAVAMLLAGCSGGRNVDVKAVMDELDRKIEAIVQDSTLTDQQMSDQYGALIKDTYLAHKADSAGLALFIPLITNFCTPEEALSLYDEASVIIKENTSVKTKIESIQFAASVTPGNPYKEISGVDAVSGEPLNLSAFVTGDRKILVDFWASWCGPCRLEIKSNLLDLAAEGKIQIVGVAVWEDSVDDTKAAMSELGITWPVIYTGGRENSPSVQYGVLGIPTLFLLSPDGTILASGHSVEKFADQLQ